MICGFYWNLPSWLKLLEFWRGSFPYLQMICYQDLLRIVAHAFLPDFGYHAVAETAIGDAFSQLHWVFNEGGKLS